MSTIITGVCLWLGCWLAVGVLCRATGYELHLRFIGFMVQCGKWTIGWLSRLVAMGEAGQAAYRLLLVTAKADKKEKPEAESGGVVLTGHDAEYLVRGRRVGGVEQGGQNA